MNLLVVTNAPGEIATWVRPVARAIREENQAVRIICLLSFCQFASGEEAGLLKEIPEIGAIIPPREYLKVILKGRLPCGAQPEGGAVLHLGGDPIHSLLVARRLGWKTAIYTYRPETKLIKYFDRIIVLDKAAKEKVVARGMQPIRVEAAGDLVVDSINETPQTKGKFCKRYSLNMDCFTIGFLAGSRKEHAKNLLPFFLRVAELIKERSSRFQFFTLLAPSIRQEFIEGTLEGSQDKILSEGEKISILTSQGLRIPVIQGGIEAMNMADFVLTIPGSNTGQMASMGIPMLVVAPLNAPELIPLEGIWGLVGRIPWAGISLKKYFVKKVSERTPFTALPNIRARRLIVPEMRGILSPLGVAKRVLGYLKELDRKKVSNQLQETMGLGGASKRLARVILSMME